jgi:hypothetical protein
VHIQRRASERRSVAAVRPSKPRWESVGRPALAHYTCRSSKLETLIHNDQSVPSKSIEA